MAILGDTNLHLRVKTITQRGDRKKHQNETKKQNKRERKKKDQYLPPTNKVTALEESRQGFRGRQADQDSRVEVAPQSGLGRSLVDVPRRGRIHRSDRNLRLPQRPDHRRERFADLPRETEPYASTSVFASDDQRLKQGLTEHGVNDVVRRLERAREIVHKRHLEVFQLFRQPLVTPSVSFGSGATDASFVDVTGPVHLTRCTRASKERMGLHLMNHVCL